MDELTSIGFKILDFVNANGPTNVETLKNNFPDIDSIDLRAHEMSKIKYNSTGRVPLKNSSFLVQKYECVSTDLGPHQKETGIFSITDYGKKALQDYKESVKEKRKELWLKNAWIPILVSVATTSLINGLQWLLPLIQQWVSNSPLKNLSRFFTSF